MAQNRAKSKKNRDDTRGGCNSYVVTDIITDKISKVVKINGSFGNYKGKSLTQAAKKAARQLFVMYVKKKYGEYNIANIDKSNALRTVKSNTEIGDKDFTIEFIMRCKSRDSRNYDVKRKLHAVYVLKPNETKDGKVLNPYQPYRKFLYIDVKEI